MKATQAVRILNANKYLGHRCWRYLAKPDGPGLVETHPRGCHCKSTPWQFGAIEAVARARYLLGEITMAELALMYHDMANWPDPEEPLTDSE